MPTPLRYIFILFLTSLLHLTTFSAFGQVSVSGGTGGNTLCSGGGYITLSDIVIAETGANNNDINLPTLSLQTLNLTLSNAAFEFEPNVGSFYFTGTGSA